MQRKYFALEPGGPPRLSVFYEMVGGNFIVAFDKRQAKPGTREELAAGKYYRAPDGTRIFVRSLPLEAPPAPLPQNETGGFQAPPPPLPVPQIEVLRDGEPLPEVKDVLPREQIRNAASLLAFVGVLEIGLGFWLLQIMQGQTVTGIPRPLLTGVIFLVCAWAMWRQKMWAARAAIVVAGLDAAIALSMALRGGGSGVLITLIARVVVIGMLLRALENYRELQEAKREMAERESPLTS
jgi:hypothetical protein